MTTTPDDYETDATAEDEREHLLDPTKTLRVSARGDDNEPKSILAVRIAGADIDRLRAAAERSGEGVTVLARRFILEGLHQTDVTGADPELIATISQAIDESRHVIADALARSVGHLTQRTSTSIARWSAA
ncbi:MAG: hypothetical protein ACYC1D_09785 [Acidimicrobiales bacterium]